MPSRAVVYDLSRLATRILNRTPNGIDRLDDLLAGHFLARQPAWPLLFGLNGPRIVGGGLETVEGVRASWGEARGEARGEFESAASERVLAAVFGALAADAAPARLEFQTGAIRHAARGRAIVESLARHGLMRGRDPVSDAPRDAIFLNATHFPIEWRRHVAWLDRRPDIRPVLFVHDVLPVSRPGLFWPGEAAKHRRRLQFLARRGAGALVTSATAEEELRRVLGDEGRRDLPIFRAAPPVQDIFFDRRCPAIPAVAPYFVVCGTIEPRKNHLLLARVWRRLIRTFGRDAPKLLVVGKRGWSIEPIVAALHAPELRGHVVEASGVPTPAYRALLGGAAALLAPSLDEGFGLTLAEALTAGVPAIASDIPAHRGQAGGHALLLAPGDEDAWFESVAAWFSPGSAERRAAIARLASYEPVSRPAYLAGLETFLAGL